MFHEVLALGSAAVGTHYFATLIQTLLHRAVGHRRAGGRLCRAHMLNHHAIYRRTYTAPAYLDEEQSLTVYYLSPIAACTALAFWLLSPLFAVTVLAAFLLSMAAHAYVHVQYHLDGSTLARFSWFRRRQRLHQLHHEQPNRNFGVLEFFWDRLLGTYTSQSIAKREVPSC